MARLGLGDAWQCIFANEWCEKKALSYKANFGGAKELRVADVAKLTIADLPEKAELAWASFPCQDLSLAGLGAGLFGKRSGAFTPFWNLIRELVDARRAPKIIVLENVIGALTSNEGKDFAAIIECLKLSGYAAGALVIDANAFLPQSRSRLFIVGLYSSSTPPSKLSLPGPWETWHSRSVLDAYGRLPESLKQNWVWWSLPRPSGRVAALSAIIEADPAGVEWHTAAETERLISLMSPVHLDKLEKAKRFGYRIIGAVYKRTRLNDQGVRVHRAEIRFDQVAGCLRTPGGGSSRQSIVVVEGQQVQSRLISPREAARLMGLPETYILPSKYNDAYHLLGDGLAVPVVSWLEAHLLHPLALTPETVMAV